MPTPTKGARLGGSPAHERLMLANLATSLFTHGRITTTETKAKRLRPFAERLITKARANDLHNRREIQKVIRDKDVVHKLLAEIGPQFATRPGGYTRITRTMPRKGDNAPMAVIELVTGSTVVAEADRARRVRSSRTGSSAAPAGPAAAVAPVTAAPSGDAPSADAPGDDAGVSTSPSGSATAPSAAASADPTAATGAAPSATTPSPQDPAEGGDEAGTESAADLDPTPAGSPQDPAEGADTPGPERTQQVAQAPDAASPVVESPTADVDEEPDGPASRA